MKKIIFTLLTFCSVYLQINAQHCSNPSDNTVCISLDTATKPGLAPLADSLMPLINGTNVSVVIQFRNYDTATVSGVKHPIYALRIDTISNLPAGLCWASNMPNDSFGSLEYGCILVSGTVCAAPGQYKLNLAVTANLGSAAHVVNYSLNGDDAGLYYFIRVNNSGDVVTAIDTTGETAKTVPTFISYNNETATGCTSGIGEIGNHINSLTIYPNPFTTEASVSFYSDRVERVTEKLTNVLGSEVYSKDLDVTMGVNSYSIAKGALTSGVYFYSISDGKSVFTKRIVITE